MMTPEDRKAYGRAMPPASKKISTGAMAGGCVVLKRLVSAKAPPGGSISSSVESRGGLLPQDDVSTLILRIEARVLRLPGVDALVAAGLRAKGESCQDGRRGPKVRSYSEQPRASLRTSRSLLPIPADDAEPAQQLAQQQSPGSWRSMCEHVDDLATLVGCKKRVARARSAHATA